MSTKSSALVFVLSLLLGCQGSAEIDEKQTVNNGEPNNGAENNLNNNGKLNNGENNVIVEPDPPHSGGDPFADPHPNLVPQSELFQCSDAPSSSPVRVRRIAPTEWAQNVFMNAYATTIPFLSDEQHYYSSYASDETLDMATLQEVLRVDVNSGGSWESSTGNSSPRLAIMRQASAAKDKTSCFQNRSNGPQNSDPDDACIASFLEGFLEYGVYFRPPTEEEVLSLTPVVKRLLANEERVEGSVTTEARVRTINLISRSAWLTSGALFRNEIGEEPDADGRRRLSDWELGLALSFAIGDTAPGQSKLGYNEGATHFTLLPDIRQAMEDGTIQDSETIARIIRYHMAGQGIPSGTLNVDGQSLVQDPPRGPGKMIQVTSSASSIEPFYEDEYWMSRKLERFFHQWLGYNDVYAIFKDTPEATSSYLSAPPRTPTFRHRNYTDSSYKSSSLPRLLDNMIAKIVAEDKDVLKKLLTTREFLLPQVSDQSTENAPYRGYIYNIDIDNGGTLPTDLTDRWVTMPANERAGVLTHPAWLAAHSANFENDPNPIHRGKWVWENLLCGWIDNLPVGVNAMLPIETANASTRERFASAGIDEGFCGNCHTTMNPLGYAFEIYNHAGFMRNEDHGNAPNGSATLQFTPKEFPGSDKIYTAFSKTPGDTILVDGMQVSSAIEMMEAFGDSQHVKQCFIRHSFRYFMGRDESRADACTLDQMETAYDDSNGSMIEMLIALFQSDTFLFRLVPEEDEEKETP